MTDGPREVSPRELVAITEESWAPRLHAVSLVAEVDVPHAQAVQALQALRMLNRASGTAPLRQWPACVAVGMVAVAAEDYTAGNYWTAFFQHLDEPVGQYTRRDFGEAFLRALDHFGLPTPTNGGQRYLGPLTLHAAVPTYCLADLFQLLAQRDRRTPGLDGETFVAWATGLGAPTRLNSLDVPARRFIQSGGEFAIDIVDRLLEMLRALPAGETDLLWTGLPERMVTEALRLRELGRLEPTTLRSASRGTSAGVAVRPTLEMDIVNGSVVVALPPVGEAPDGRAIWKVVVDGRPETVISTALWPGSIEPAPATQMVVRRPARSAVVSLTGSQLTYELDVVDAKDPLLVFAEDGRHVPAAVPLAPGTAWLLHPTDKHLEVSGAMTVVAEVAPPLGWEGWTLQLLRLDAVENLSIGGRRRWVRRTARPRLLLADPVPGATTRYGSPVHSEPPAIALPANTTPVTWTVTIRDAGRDTPLSTRQHQADASYEVIVDPFAGLRQPLLGSFDINVRGPLGSGVERRVAIAEGLRLRSSVDFRAFTGSGLAPVTVGVSVAPGMYVSAAEVNLTERELTWIIDLSSPDANETIYVTPPHMRVARLSESDSSRWFHSPLRMTVESMAEPGQLVLGVPAGLNPPSLRVRAGGTTLQHLEPSGRSVAGQATYELARIVDTVRAQGRADLVIDLADMVVPIAHISPGRLASACEVDGTDLVLRDFAGVSDVSAGLYMRLAPWREPVVVSVHRDGRAPLPEECQNSGPLEVLLRLEDPWLPEPWPEWPVDSAFRALQSGAPRLDRNDGSEVVDYLALASPIPTDPATFPFLWMTLYRQLLGSLSIGRDIREDASTVFRTDASAALAALLATSLDENTAVRLVVNTGLALLGPVVGLDELRQLWQQYPAAAAIAGVPTSQLPIDAIETRCGGQAISILAGSDDPYARSGAFDASAQRLAMMSSAQVEQFWSAARIVPGGLLDAESRVASARELFDARRHPRLSATVEAARVIVADGGSTLRSSGAPQRTHVWIDARRGDRDAPAWVDLPAASAVLAGLARRAARGDEACSRLLGRAQRLWDPLVTCAPQLVATDLVIAEFLERGDADPASMPDGGQL